MIHDRDTEGKRALQELALAKMTAVLGPARAQQLMTRILTEHAIELRTPDDLFRFATELGKHGGFEGAVGAMLGVRAVMLGAAGSRPESG
jgi:hypothetical protein